MASTATTKRTVLITGASRGLGLGIARNLVASGYGVIAVSRTKSDELKSLLDQATGGDAVLHFVAFDLSKVDEIPQLVRTLRNDFGPLFGLVNNAAVGHSGPLSLMHNSQIEELLRINTLAPIILSKYVVRSMMSEGAGRIVNVASIVGFSGYTGLSVYAATKASMLGFTRSLSREVGKLGITVNAIAPGFLDTEMTSALGEEQRSQVARRSALRKLASVEDVAHMVAYLFSDKAQHISGTVITVDAGATA